jgi:hypothetical protein
MVLQITSVPEGIFISQYSLAFWFSYFGRVSQISLQISLRYIILKQSKALVSSRTYAFPLFKCKV